MEGRQVWDLALRLGGQMRVVAFSGLGGAQVVALGYDMSAVLALGAAMGVPPPAVAEWIPLIERAAVAATNEAGDDG